MNKFLSQIIENLTGVEIANREARQEDISSPRYSAIDEYNDMVAYYNTVASSKKYVYRLQLLPEDSTQNPKQFYNILEVNANSIWLNHFHKFHTKYDRKITKAKNKLKL